MVGSVYGAGGAGIGSVVEAVMSLTIFGDAYACGRCSGSVLAVTVVPV